MVNDVVQCFGVPLPPSLPLPLFDSVFIQYLWNLLEGNNAAGYTSVNLEKGFTFFCVGGVYTDTAF